ncbi:MAG TPA: cytochrome c biogenesis protein CcdA [Gemmatimonadaceae bacterium]|nr:cytochrome c biogenesis protein CcdA [Gemmatimonadaceae bacterium]
MIGHYLWLAVTAGAVSLLTPCVFPMIPITVSYFTNHASSQKAGLRSALIFAGAIVGSFTALGLILALLFGATGVQRFAANPYLNIFLAGLFVAFALNLFGVYQIALPSRALTALDTAARGKESSGSHVAGAMLMGLTFALTSFTCTAPFVGTVLVTAATGAWREPAIGMLAYSTVFALPFFVLALIPQWAARLPRAGRWLATVKVVMGFLELAAALKFVSNADLVWHWGIFNRDVVLALWVALAGLMAAYLVASGPGSIARLATAAAALGVGIWLATGLVGRSLGELETFLPPPASHRDSYVLNLNWHVNDLPGAIALAKQSSKPVFIDFTGYTCTNCRWMEANVFSRTEVKAELNRFALARLFTDGEGSVYENQQAYQERTFNTVALPLYAVVAPDGHTIATLPGLTRDPAVFLAFLEKNARAQ